MKLLRWLDRNILLSATLVLLAFIPLYPKLPIFGITRTWVYVRLDDFLIAVAIGLYLFELYRRKATWKTPLTYAILAFWLVGLIATVLGILFIFPQLEGVFPHIALLYYLRHIEYLSVFFIAYSAVKDKKQITPVIAFIIATFFAVVMYALGQRFLPEYFPAFSTMNEEFAKGLPLFLSADARIQSTFAGHYDLAAYLVLMIPVLGSLIFGVKTWFKRIGLLLLTFSGVIILLMTASRTSFAVYICSVITMLILQKQKKWIIPVLIVSSLLLFSFQGLYTRYISTVSKRQILYNDKNQPISVVTKDKNNNYIVNNIPTPGSDALPGTQPISAGHDVTTVDGIDVQQPATDASPSGKTRLVGKYTIKEQQTLDTSFATRWQLEWPNAIKAFKRNIFFGSGYSTITLATDGNYFRMLGETGILGLVTFLSIIGIYALHVFRSLKSINSPIVKSLILGIIAGIFGLMLNAVLIDIFEASKIAYILWLLVGISLSIIHLYKPAKGRR